MMKPFENLLQNIFRAESLTERKLYIGNLYQGFYDKLFGIAYATVKDEGLCEDAVQEVAFKLMTMEKELFPAKSYTAWLYSVVKNHTLNLFKKQKASVNYLSLETAATLEQSIDDYVDMDEFNSLIKNLDEKRRNIVTLKIIGGYTHKEIAQILGEKQGTVQWLYATAIKSLKAVLITTLSAIGVCLTGILSAAFKNGGIFSALYSIYAYANSGIISADSSASKLNFNEILLFFCLTGLIVLTVFLTIFLKSEHKKRRRKRYTT